jgi:uncharacterized protein with FMN-binding domain
MKSKIILSILIVLVILIAVSLAAYLFIIKPQQKSLEKVRAMDIQAIEGTMVEDGTYRGDFEYSNTGVSVLVTVAHHQITQIEILKGGINEYGLRAESIVDSVVQANSTDVDVITGSTTTSKALLKAIENALKKGYPLTKKI